MEQQAPSWKRCVHDAAVTDVGMRRNNNQDAFAVVPASSEDVWLSRGHLFMVADGMGAHAAGELASEIATEVVPHTYHKLRDTPSPEALRTAIQDANVRIHNRGQADVEFHGMGTTTSVLVLMPQGAVLAHVGDSRIYRIRGNRLEQLTFDHSLVWEMMAAGKIQEDEVPSYVPKNVITRSLGPNPEVEIDLEGPFPLSVGDTFLLCSDGLTGPVKDEEIGAIVSCLEPEAAVQVLVDLANLRGGPDNITVVIVRIVGQMTTSAEIEPLPPPADSKQYRKPISKALIGTWVLLAVLVLAILPLLFSKQFIPAGVSLVGALVAGLVLRFKFGVGAEKEPEQVIFGRGPYRSYQCPPSEEFSGTLSGLVEELSEAAGDNEWTIDWDAYRSARDRGAEARRQQRYDQAIREYCAAISALMADLRRQRAKKKV